MPPRPDRLNRRLPRWFASLLVFAILALAACQSGAQSRDDSGAANEDGSQTSARGKKGGRKALTEQEKQARRAARKAEKGGADGRAAAAPAASAVATVRLADPLPTEERSAAAVSAVAPDVFYTINDSGHDADLFAIDSTGANRGRWTIRGARNRDWEALAVGPCGADAAARTASCVYVGDVGDNGKARTAIEIYRVKEPLGTAAGTRGSLHSTLLSARYPDGSHNVEAMYVAADGAIVLITKATGEGGGAKSARARLYRIPATAWGDARGATATLVDSLPEFDGGGRKRLVTDAARSSDGRYLAVRTYAWVATFALDSATGLPRRGAAPALCDLAALAETQGEGVGFIGKGNGRLVLTSEGKDEPLRLATCPLPTR